MGTKNIIGNLTVDGSVAVSDELTVNGHKVITALPAAGEDLGGVKSGGDVTITEGVITVNDDSHNHTIENVDGLQSTLAGKAAVDHSHVLTPTTTSVVKEINSGSGSFTPTTKYLHETTASAAPNAHTHSVAVSGTTGENSGTGVSVVTGVTSNGTATALTGVQVTAQPTISLAEDTSSATGRAQYVKSIAGGSGDLTTDTTATDGIQYVESVSGGSAVSKTTKYMKFSAGTTPKSGATPNHTATPTEEPGEEGVTVVTGVAANGTATALTGVKVTANPTIDLTANTATATGRITYVESISGGSGSLTTDTTATNGIKYVEGISSTGASASGTAKAGSETHTHTYSKASLSGSNSSHTVKYMKFSAGTTPPSSATPNTTSTNSGANSGTAVTALTGVKVTTQPTIGLTANTATATGRIKYVESISGGSGSLKSYDAATDGTAKTSSGRIQYVHDVSHTAASLTGTTTFVTAQGTFSAGTTPVSSASFTGSAVTSGANSGDAVTAVTGVGANGTASALTGVKVSSSSSAAPGGHTHTVTVSGTTGNNSGTGVSAVNASVSGTLLTLTTVTAAPHTHTHSYGNSTALTTSENSGANFNAATAVAANGTATVLTGVKASSTASVAPSGHTHSVTAAGSIELTRGTAPSLGKATTGTVGISGGSIGKTIYYLEHGHTGASATTKYLSASASGTAVGANGTASVAPSGHTHAYDKTTSITLTAGTAPSMNFNTETTTDTPYVASATNSSLTLSHTSTASGGPSATTTFVTGVTGGTTSATTKYLHHSHSAASATTKYLSASASGTAVGANGTATVLTGVKASSTADVAPLEHTHSYAKTTSISLTAGTAPSMNFNTGSSSDTPYISAVSGGSAVEPITKYLHHTHTAASATTRYMSATASGTAVGANGTATVLTGVKASGTATVAPNEHTHTFSDDATTAATTASPVTVITDLTANTTPATGDIAYLESATHTHTGASVKTTDTVLKSVTID